MILLIVLSIIICIVGYFIYNRKIYNPIMLFNGIWLIIFILYEMRLINFITISQKVLYILLIMIIAFPIGTVLGNNLKRKNNTENSIESNQVVLKEKMFWILCILSFIIMLIVELPVLQKLSSGMSFHNIIVENSGNNTVEIKGINVFLYMFIVYPCTYFVSPICASQFFSKNVNKKKKKWYLVINILIVGLGVAHHGGRNSIIQFALCYGLCYLIHRKKKSISLKKKIAIFISIIILLLGINKISISRGIDDLKMSYYSYLTATIPLSERYLSNPKISNYRLRGYLSFNGYIYPIATILNKFGFSNSNRYIYTQDVRNIIDSTYLSIGDYSHNMNAFMSAGTYLYIDGGYLFELIAMLIYGIYVGYVYKKVNNSKYLSIYILLSIGLVLSFSRICFSTVAYAIGLIYVYMLYTQKKENIRNEKS